MTEFDWNNAMAKYGSQLPSKAQAEVLVENNKAINQVLSVYGGARMDRHSENIWYWTKTEDENYSSLAWNIDMDDAYLYTNGKTRANRVRAVAPLP